MDSKLITALCIFLLMASATGDTNYDKCEFGQPNFTLNCSVDYVKLKMFAYVIMDTHFGIYISNCGAYLTRRNFTEDFGGCDNKAMIQKWNLSSCFDATDHEIIIYYRKKNHLQNCQISTTCKFRALNSTISMKSSSYKAIISEPYWIHCIVTTSEKVNSNIVKIDWRGPDGSIVNDSRITIQPTVTDDGIMHNSSLQFSYISQNDTGTFTCDVKILDINASETLQLTTLKLTIFMKSSPDKAIISKPYWIHCIVNTSEKINSSAVKIDWRGPDGSIVNNSRITIQPTVSDGGIMHKSSLQFLYISQNDTGTFTCDVKILDANISETLQLDNFTTLKLTIFMKSSPDKATISKPFWIHCIVNTSEKINSSIVKIDWRGPDGSIVNDNRITIEPTVSNDGIIHNSSLQFLYISQNDTGTFTCGVKIFDTHNYSSETFQLYNFTESILVISSMNTLLPTPSITPPETTSARPLAKDNASLNDAAFIIATVIGLLFIIVLISMFVYKLRRRMQLQSCFSSNDSIPFKIPSISEIPYSVPYNDDASTCESLNTNYNVTQWMKNKQLSNLNESCDGIYPSNEEILNYVCGQNFLYHDLKHINENVECNELPNADAESIDTVTSDSINIQQSVHCITSCRHNKMETVDDESFNDNWTKLHTHDDLHNKVPSLCITMNTSTKSVPDKMYVMYNTTCLWHLSQIDKENSSNFPHQCYDRMIATANFDDTVQQANSFSQSIKRKCEGAVSEEMVNFGMPSQVSSDKLTENIFAPSVSLQRYLIVVDYIESKTAMQSVTDNAYTEKELPVYSENDNVNCIPLQSRNSHQSGMIPLNETLLTNTAMKGEYVDYYTAIQQTETSA